MKVNKIDLELAFKKLQYDEASSIGLISFFTAIKNLADKHLIDASTLVQTITENLD